MDRDQKRKAMLEVVSNSVNSICEIYKKLNKSKITPIEASVQLECLKASTKMQLGIIASQPSGEFKEGGIVRDGEVSISPCVDMSFNKKELIKLSDIINGSEEDGEEV